MERRETSKLVTIGDKSYQLNKTDARTSCWLFSFLGDKSEGKVLLTALGKCTKEEFNIVQYEALRKVNRIDVEGDKEFPIPIVKSDGTLIDKFLEENPNLLFDLTLSSVLYNISPFLKESDSNSQT